MEQLPKPESRKELYLSKIAGTGTELPKEPWSREEQYLNYIAVNGGGNLDFDKAENRPKYNNETMSSATNIPEVPSDLVQIIPNQASPTNQLADKNFVNSSIATSTAKFMGTFNSLEELEAVQGADDNDYGFVVSKDSAGNTLYSRYKYSGTEWLFEYTLNNSSFTAEQWAAIQSGITSGGVAKLNGLANIKSIGDGLSLDSDTGTLNNTNENVALYDTIGQNTDGAMTQKATTNITYWQGDSQKISIGNGYCGADYSISIAASNKNQTDTTYNSRATGKGSIAISGANGCSAEGQNSIAIGSSSQARAIGAVHLGSGNTSSGAAVDNQGVQTGANYSVALGYGALVSQNLTNSIALGAYSKPTSSGELNIGTGNSTTNVGYNNSNYRLLTGVYDGQSANDAVNVGQINALIDAINAAASLSIPHIGAGE